MIKIEIDRKSCVGCELCVDECPTDVLVFIKEEEVARVDKIDDCIECMSCYYICPAAAVDYEEANICPDFHRDYETINMAECMQ